jgi:tetratricopeptide (TPR) repeat protein
MKKIVLSITLCICMFAVFAQSEKYKSAMKEKIAVLDTSRDMNALKDMSAAFERIGDAEKTQWLPYYYAALSLINAGNLVYIANPSNVEELKKIDPLAEKAEQLIEKADALSQNNSEIYAAKKMAATLRMMVDPMSRYMQYGAKAQEALETARKLNPENPRIYLLEGEDKFYTPEQFGGSKTEAKKLFDEALKKYDSFKPASDIDPNWGKNMVEYFLNQIKS